MDNPYSSPQTNDPAPDSAEHGQRFLLLWLVIAQVHFILLGFFSLFFAWSTSALVKIIAITFGGFVILGECVAGLLIDYRGQDSIQWPLIIANSLFYGAVLALLYRRVR